MNQQSAAGKTLGTVVEAGPRLLVVDEGRPGWAHLGVTTAGPYDRGAYHRANRLVGNLRGAAALEALLGPLELKVEHATTLAVAGVAAEVQVVTPTGGRAADTESVLTVPAGSTVRIGRFSEGLRGYIAIRGGLATPVVLGSRSADTLGSLGPGPLEAGQVLITGNETTLFPDVNNTSHHARRPARDSLTELRLLPSPRSGIHADLRRRLLEHRWRVNQDSDRVGMRLDLLAEDGDELSESGVSGSGGLDDLRSGSQPLVRGALQMPTHRNAVIMGPDHPTVGGYPVVGVVQGTDQDRLAQLRPGDLLVFRGEPGELTWLRRTRDTESPVDDIDWW